MLVTFAIGVEHFRGRHMLNTRLAELKTRGEELEVAELEPRHPPAEQNAALALLALTNEISQLHSNLLEAPPAGRFAAPGRMVMGWQFESWAGEKRTNNWRQLRETMEASNDVLQAIHQALQRPEWDVGFDYQKGFYDFQPPPLVHLKLASQILITAVACDLKQDRTNAALQRLTDAVRLVGLQKDERLIISQLVRIAGATLAWSSTWNLLQTNAWSDDQLATLQTAWQELDFSTDMARALEMERAMTLDYFREVSGSWAKLKATIQQQESAEEMLGGEFVFLPMHGLVLHWICAPLWRWAWADQDARRALDRWQEMIETDRIARHKSWALAKDRGARLDQAAAASPWLRRQDEQSQQSLYDRCRYLLSNQTFGLGGGLIRRVLQTETARRMMVTALALTRHRLRHGQPAVTLERLVPELLPAIPLDGMDGKPLRYRLNPDGTFLLYSVGEDGKDDGGDAALGQGKTIFAQIWDGKDAIYPTPATAEEAAKLARQK